MIYTDGTHLVADTEEELHTFAQKIGLKRKWYQCPDTHPHYDLTTRKKYREVLDLGVKIVEAREVLRISLSLLNK
jgi:hypothetical protein